MDLSIHPPFVTLLYGTHMNASHVWIICAHPNLEIWYWGKDTRSHYEDTKEEFSILQKRSFLSAFGYGGHWNYFMVPPLSPTFVELK